MIILLALLILLIPTFANATTYWVSPAGGSSTCSAVDGDADPGVYMTLAQIDTSNCASAGDTVMFKAGTYTGAYKLWHLIIPSGTSPTNRSTTLCEGDRTCIIAFSSIPFSEAGPITAYDVSYYQIGAIGHGFKTTCVNSSNPVCGGIYLQLSTSTTSHTDVIVEGNEIVANTKSAITNKENQPGAIYTNLQWRYNRAMEPGTPAISAGPPHAYYLKARNSLLEHNQGKTFGGSESGSVCLHGYHIATGNTIRYNYCEVENLMTGFVFGDSETGLPGLNKVYGNVFKALGATPKNCFSFLSSSDSSEYYNNVCDGFGNGASNYFMLIRSGANNNILKNNVCAGTCTISNSGTGTDCGGTCSTTNPTITMATHFRDPANGDYTLKAGSSQIDAGLDAGFPYNGSGRDRGAHETFVFASCEVPSDATSTVRVTFTNNAHPPLLPATGATTFTVRKNGSSNAVSGSVDRSGDGIYVIPVTNSYAGGDTVDISLSTNNITDSALIGGDANQPYVGTLTNQSCTNNAAGAPAHTFTQAAFELHDWLGDEDAPVILPYGFASTGEAENFANYKVRKGGKIRLRFSIVCGGANCPPTAFNLYRSTGGAYSPLTDSFGVSGGFKFCGEVVGAPTNGGPTTNQLSTAGTFVAGGVMYTASAVPTISGLNTGYKTELEYCVDVRDTASTGNVDFRVYQQDGTALNAHTVTPRIVIDEISAGAN